MNASRAHVQSAGQRKRADQKAKQRATDQQGVRAIVANVLERQGIEPEDWERSQRTDYRVDHLRPPTWVVCSPPGQHLATLKGVAEDEWQAEPDITPEELLRRLTVMARGTSQACSHRSQELYFRVVQVLKETIKDYEDQQGVQYGENAVHLDRDLVGLLIATFVHLQRELQVARDWRQLAWDREVDAKVQCKEAEKREAQLKCDLKASQAEVLRAQETAREHEREYHETLVLLKRAQDADPATANADAQVRIQSLETQLNNTVQQLNRLRAEHAPNAADGQMAVQQSEINEQLEALRADNVAVHQALEEVAVECDNLRRSQVQLRSEMLTGKAKQDAASSALEVKCLQAEAEVVELKEKVAAMERRGGYHAPPATASATVGSSSQPASGGRGRGLVCSGLSSARENVGSANCSGSSLAREGIERIRREATTDSPFGRAGSARPFRAIRNWVTQPHPDSFSRDGIGAGYARTGQRLGAPAANAGQAQEPESAMDVDGADHAP